MPQNPYQSASLLSGPYYENTSGAIRLAINKASVKTEILPGFLKKLQIFFKERKISSLVDLKDVFFTG